MEKVLPYLKFVVAIVGAAVTTALTLTTIEAPEYKWLMIASSILTAIAVYAVPNKPAVTPTP